MPRTTSKPAEKIESVKQQKDCRLTIRINSELDVRLRRKADEEGRSISNMVNKIIEDNC